MINYQSENFEAKKDMVNYNLPAGAYIGKILGAKVETQTIGGRTIDRLVLQMDVTDGEFAGHYVKQFENAKGGNFTPKFKGVLRLNIPVKGDQYEQMNKRILQGAAWALEESNSGYHWDWDETKLKGLAVGFSVREADYLIEDASGVKTGTTTEIYRLESVKEVASGKVKTPKRRELKEAQKQRLAESRMETEGYVKVEDDELPF